MNLIVAVDNNWSIGYKNNLLFKIPEDMKYFKEKTMNNIVVMGRSTLESFPDKKPLKNRTNIVLTTNKDYNVDGVIIKNSIFECLEYLNNFEKNRIFIIGGESIYKQFITYCENLYVTRVLTIKKADKYFINLDQCSEWNLENESEIKTYNDLNYKFTKYQRIRKR